MTSCGDFCAGAPRYARVGLMFVTRPSLSSLKLCRAALAFLVCFVVGFVAAGAACLRVVGFATRVVVVAFEVILARAGRGIVANNYRCEWLWVCLIRLRVKAIQGGLKWWAAGVHVVDVVIQREARVSAFSW